MPQRPPLSPLRAISRLSEVAAQAAGVEAIYAEALDVLVELLAADRGAVLLFDPDGVLRFKAWRGLSDAYRAAVEGHSPWAADDPDPQPVLVPDVTRALELAGLLPVISAEGIAAVAFLPLRTGGRLLGKFMVYFDRPHPFGEDEVDLAEAIAAQVAFAIDRLRLEDELRLANGTLAATLDAAADGITAQAPDGHLLFANDEAAAMLGCESPADLLGADPAEIMTRFELFDEHGAPFPLTDLPGRQALAGLQPSEVLVRWRWRDTGEERWSLVSARPVCGEDGSVRFAVNVFRDITERQRAVEALHESERRMAFLAKASPNLLGTTLDYSTVFERVAELFVPDLADACTVRELAPDGSIRRVAARHSDLLDAATLDALDSLADPARRPLLRDRLETGASLLLSQVNGHAPADAGGHPRLGSAIVVPLAASGRVLGSVSLMTVEGGRRYTEADVALVDEVARRAALAIQNAKLFAERSTVAATLQRAFLPPALPPIPGVELAARYHAAASEIGGDFYDVVPLEDGRWLVVLGDVCGKGIEAASLTAMVRYTLRAFAASEIDRPSRLLARLNHALVRQLNPDRFCTVAVALLEPGRDAGAGAATHVTLSLGGHPRPLLVTADGDVRPVGTPGTLLGTLPSPDLADEDLDLGPGDALVLFTDGCLREGPTGSAEADLMAAVQAYAGAPATGLVEAVEQSAQLDEHVDDVTVLALRRIDR